MKINPSVYNVGMTNTQNSIRPADESRTAKLPEDRGAARHSGNTDKILISFEGALQAEVEQLGKAITAKIEQPTPPQRLSAIKSAVENGTYRVDTATLVDTLMTKWIGL